MRIIFAQKPHVKDFVVMTNQLQAKLAHVNLKLVNSMCVLVFTFIPFLPFNGRPSCVYYVCAAFLTK